jgi:hypothetical protein
MSEKRNKGMSRREFARRAALASAAALSPAAALPAKANAAAMPGSGQASDPAAKSVQQPPNAPKLSAESQAEADARAQVIFAQYGSRFSDDEKTDIHRLCVVAQQQVDRVRAYHLRYGDAPALYLKPLVEREKKTASTPAAKPTAAASPSKTSTKTAPSDKKP